MTKRKRDNRLDSLEEQLSNVDGHGEQWSVEWREANPSERPEGMAVDAENRVLYYDAWQAQRETLDALESGENDIVALLGGYGAGKTVFGADWIVEQAIDNPGSHFLAMGTSYSEARTATYRTLYERLPGDRTHILATDFNGPEQSPLVADYNRSTHSMTLYNDSVITLGSADKWNRHAGDSYGAIWMDEPSHYAVDLHDLLEMMGSRLRGQPGAQTMLFTLTGNGYNDAWEIIEKRETPDGHELGHAIELITASTLDNPYFSEEEKESFKRQYEGTMREEQALHGGFAAAQGLVYSNFSRDTHVVEPAKAESLVDDTDEFRMYGYDAGWNDPRVLLEVGKTPYDQLVVLDEFYESGAHVEDAIRWLEVNDKPKGRIYCEHEPSDIQKFRQANWPAEQAEKSIDAGISEVRKRLDSDGNMDISVKRPRVDLRLTGFGGNLPADPRPPRTPDEENSAEEDSEKQERVGLLVSARCEELVREFHGYKEEHVGTAAADDHCLDSLRYLVTTSASDGAGTFTRRTPGSAGKL